jgi:hypothetical protein
MAHTIVNLERIEGGIGQLPRTRTSSVPVTMIREEQD